MASINHYGTPHALPDFRNLGVIARILVIVTLATMLAAALRAASWAGAIDEFMALSTAVQPALLLALIALYAGSVWLARLPYWHGVAAVLAVAAAAPALVHFAGGELLGGGGPARLARYWLFSLAGAVVLLAYFDLRGRALSPALSEARLQALQARIRPHFLFNCINAVLSLIRSEPQRAEAALEDLAELFRVLMAENRELSTLGREVELARQYLRLEQLRLGERLRVEWQTEGMPAEALVPPLVLQPLLENAVYHGVEPAAAPGVISVSIYRSGDEVHAVLANPYREDGAHHAGNRMALDNIRERLSLFFDAEARLETRQSGDAWQVHIVLPYLTAPRR